MRLTALLTVALIGWVAFIGGVGVARHVAGRAEKVVDHLHWSTFTRVNYPPKHQGKR